MTTSENPDPAEAALSYAARGWPVFPCGDDKKPLVPHGLTEATTDPETIRAWWKRWPKANPAIRTGAESGLVVIDADLHKPGAAEALASLHLSPTRIHRTPRRGYHHIYTHPGGRVPNSAGKLGTGIDVRGDGGYIVAPPSRINGSAYSHVAESGEDVQPLPEHLLERLVEHKQRPKPAGKDSGEKLHEGTRNDALFRLASSMRRRGLGEAAILAALRAHNAEACDPPLEEEEVERIAGSACRYEPGAQAEEEFQRRAKEHAESVEAEFSAADDWAEVIPLDAHAPEPMPAGILTGWAGAMAEAVSVATETPRELATLIALAVMGCTVQGKFTVRPESGYFEPVNVWTCPALDSGNRKTAVVNALAAPLYDWEREKARELELIIKRIQAERSALEERIKHKRGEFGRAKAEQLDKLKAELVDLEMNLPEIPRTPRLVAQDITPEHCGTLMAECDERLAILSDEGGIFDILAGRYSRGIPNLDLFLQAHAGAPVRVDRGSRPPVHLHHPALTIGLSPQPEVLRGLAGQPGFRGRGLLARFLYALPLSSLGHRKLKSHPVPAEVSEAYAQGVKALLSLSPAFDEDGHPRPHVLNLAGKAWSEWKDFQKLVEADMREGSRLAHITDWASKLPGAVARVAGLLHCAEHAHGTPAKLEVSADTMSRALMLGAVLITHALAVFDLMAGDPALAAARKVWRWIEREKLATFTARELHKALEGTFRRRADLDPPLEVLVERGYIRKTKALQTGPGRRSEVFEVNPSLRAAP